VSVLGGWYIYEFREGMGMGVNLRPDGLLFVIPAKTGIQRGIRE
jgi:hypothetical protein